MESGVPVSHVSTQGIKLSALEWAGLRKSREGTSSNLLTLLQQDALPLQQGGRAHNTLEVTRKHTAWRPQ